jgi:hypothetical protein
MAMVERYTVALDDLPPELEGKEQSCVFLQNHDKFPRQWEVNSLDARYLHRLDDVISRYRAVSPFAFARFLDRAEEEGYKVVFLEDPQPTFDWLDSLNSDPGVGVNSIFPNTIRGLLPFQVQGVNFAKDLRAAVFQWSTGTGKTVGACALTKYHRDHENFDLCLYVVKSLHKINTQRSLAKLVDIDSVIVNGLPRKRDTAYLEIWDQMKAGERPVVVMHYDTFRNDKDALMMLTEGVKVFAIFDEMPNKLKNRTIALYKAVVETLYKSFTLYKGSPIPQPISGDERPSELRTLMLSATPIENIPEDWFNCIRIMDPTIYGTVSEFRKKFVARMNRWHQPVEFKDVDLMGAMAAHITHQVDKEDPDIAEQFPDVMPPEMQLLELHEKDQWIYDSLADEYDKLVEKDESMLSQTELLSAIAVLHMICSNPMSVLRSADYFEAYLAEREQFVEEERPNKIDLKEWDKKNRHGSEVAYKLVQKLGPDKFDDMNGDEIRCSKMQELGDRLLAHRGKAVVFTRMNASLMPLISDHLDRLGVSHVRFHGGLTEKQKQEAQDSFKGDSSIKVFLSSDSGSDSINLEEADLVIHYDWPQKWSTKTQRENRVHRLTSEHASVRFVTLAIPNSVEDRTQEIVEMKKAYHQGAFKGEIAEQAMEMRRTDLLYILTGKRRGEDGD